MEFQYLNQTCTGGYLYAVMFGTREDIDELVASHALMVVYNGSQYPIWPVLLELETHKAPDLRAINLGPWSASGTLWMIRKGPEIPNERKDK